MKIAKNAVVAIHYSVSDSEGTLIDSSFDDEPMRFMQGSEYMIPGLEDALEGRVAGDIFEAKVEPEQAYGERHDGFVQEVPKSMFDGVEVQVGMQFRADTDQGEQSVIIVDVGDETVTVDGNHPLAGMPLVFEVEVLEVREPTEVELQHGYVEHTGKSQH